MFRLRSIARLLSGLRTDGGNVAILFAVLLPVVVGGAGLGVETTFWRYKQLQIQTAADAAAFAGALEKRAGSNATLIEGAATTAATQNGFDTVNGDLDIGGDPNSVEVVLRWNAPRFFTAVFEQNAVPLRARAVAEFEESSAVCILALDPSSSQAVLVSGNAELTLNGCNMMANSISTTAVVLQGSSETIAPCIISVGGALVSGDLTLTACSSVRTLSPRAADPYRNLPALTLADLSDGDPATTNDDQCRNDSGSLLTPGYYCNGMELNSNVVLKSGRYIIEGGLFHIRSTASITSTAGGVTIFLKGTARVEIEGGAHIDLSARSEIGDPWAGILFYGDRTSIGEPNNKFNGNASSHLTGALYFPGQRVEYAGNFSGENGCTQVVARTVNWSGNTTVNVDCTALNLPTVPSVTVVKLIE